MISSCTLIHLVKICGQGNVLDHGGSNLLDCLWFARQIGHVEKHEVLSLVLLHRFRFREAEGIKIFYNVGVGVVNVPIIDGLDGTQVNMGAWETILREGG